MFSKRKNKEDFEIDNYKDMYYNLFNAISKATESLQKAQAETEEIFISKETPETVLHDKADY